jgi:hypothetical protein
MGIFQKTTIGIVYDEWNFNPELMKSGMFFVTTWLTSDQRYIYVVLPSEINEKTISFMKKTGHRIFEIDYTVVTLEQIKCFITILPKWRNENEQSFLIK